MGTYINIKCGKCGKSMTGGYQRGSTSMLGVTHIQCKSPYCLEWNKTNSKPYSQFEKSDKLIYNGGIVLRSILIGGIFGTFPSFALMDKIEAYTVRMLVLFGFAAIGAFLYFKVAMWLTRKNISAVEEEQNTINQKMQIPIFPMEKQNDNKSLINLLFKKNK
jgi:phage FluMu protein Com